jgi:mono/diheme cytochrome c family protein
MKLLIGMAVCWVAAVTSTNVAAQTAEALIRRGDYLVNGIAACGNCHSPQRPDGSLSGRPLSGGEALKQLAFVAYPPNLTPDVDTGLGAWTEDQIVTAVREGRVPTGAILRPPMPVAFYRSLSDRDARAIAAYLRSLPPAKNKVPTSQYYRPTPASYGGRVDAVAEPNPAEKVTYGHYLAQLGHCMECHTPRDGGGRPQIERYGAGGLVLQGVFGAVVSQNITPDIDSGIGSWTDDELKTALTKGVRPDGSRIVPPMPWRYLATMTPNDVDALVAYLRILKPVAN